CPRDSDMQEDTLGEPIAADLAGLRRGDLLFWKGHVAIVRDAETLVHANAFHMSVAIEPLAAAVARIAAEGGAIRTVQPLPAPPPDLGAPQKWDTRDSHGQRGRGPPCGASCRGCSLPCCS